MKAIKLFFFGVGTVVTLLFGILLIELFISLYWGATVDWGWEEVRWEDSLLERRSSYVLSEMPFLKGKTHNLKLFYHKQGILGTGGLRGYDLWGRVNLKGEELFKLRDKLGDKFFYWGTPLGKCCESEELARMLSIPCDWSEMYLIWHTGDLDVYTDPESLAYILDQKSYSSTTCVSFYFRVGTYFLELRNAIPDPAY